MRYPDNYLYNIYCYRVHAGMTGILRFGNTEEGVLIDSCKSGKEAPMTFSLLNFAISTKLYFVINCIDCSATIMIIKNLLKKI